MTEPLYLVWMPGTDLLITFTDEDHAHDTARSLHAFVARIDPYSVVNYQIEAVA